MTWMIAAVLSLPTVQDPAAEVKRQAARITAKDPAASFDAVSRLVDLAGGSKEAVDAAANALGDDVAFYRKALKDELDARVRLGDRYGAVQRITIDAKEKTLSSVMQEVVEKSKEKIDAYWLLQSRGSQTVTVKAEDVPVLEALRAVCAEAKVRLTVQGGVLQLYDGGGGSAPAFQYRNFLLTASTIQKTRDVQFGGAVVRSVNLTLTAAWDRGVTVARTDGIEVLECLDDKGRVIEPLKKEEEKAPASDSPTVANVYGFSAAAVARLAWPPEDAEKIALLRAALVLRVPKETSSFALAVAEKGTAKSDDHFEATLDGVRTERNRTEAVVRLKPKGALADFRKMAVIFRLKVKDGDLRLCYGSGKAVEGTVEYTVNPRLLGEEQATGKKVEIESVEVVVVRTTEDRRVYFELKDLPLK
jgi:hypothetical protein